MLDGRPLVDVHLHPARLPTLKPSWRVWAHDFGDRGVLDRVYDAEGTIVPAEFAAHLAGEGVDVALLLCEYSPKATGIQPIEDLLPLVSHSPDRLEIIANLNPHLHYPVDEELERQLGLGAVALKIHPVHAGAAVNDRALYPAYEICQSAGIPVVVHSGTSSFPGSSNALADPVLLDSVLRDFRRLDVVLAHGGRGWWYDAAAFLALSNDHVWIELSGLPPSRLRQYYAQHNWNRLTRKMIFGTDWPGVPSIAGNARAVAGLCPDEETAGLVLAGNALRVYNLKLPAWPTGRPNEPQKAGNDDADWTKEDDPRWDAAKQRLFGSDDLAAVDLDPPAPGAAVADEWWQVTGDDGQVAGDGWLDSEWGDAQITFWVAPARRGAGIGDFILDHLEEEAAARGLNYIYNVVPASHPAPDWITGWLARRGFVPGTGDLRRHVPAAAPGPSRALAGPRPARRQTVTQPPGQARSRSVSVKSLPVNSRGSPASRATA